jgi:hypothetical protein
MGDATGLCRASCRPAYIRHSQQAHHIITAAGRIIAAAGMPARLATTNDGAREVDGGERVLVLPQSPRLAAKDRPEERS